MIKNKKQYTALYKQLNELLDNIKDTETVVGADRQDIQSRLQLDTFKRGLAKLKRELEEYEKLTSKSLVSLEFDSLKDDMNKAIISFRIASGMSQKELAKEMFIQEQQIQRYEQMDYLSASFERVLQLLEALGVRMILKKEFRRETQTTTTDISELNNRVKQRGHILAIVGDE